VTDSANQAPETSGIPFLQTPSGAIRLALRTLHDAGTYTPEHGFREVRVVRDGDRLHVYLLGADEGSFLVTVGVRTAAPRLDGVRPVVQYLNTQCKPGGLPDVRDVFPHYDASSS
jgi:hypothetical protein